MDKNFQILRKIEHTRDKYLQKVVSFKGRRNAITNETLLNEQTLEYLTELAKNQSTISHVKETFEEWTLLDVLLMRFTVWKGRRNALSTSNVVCKIRPQTYRVCCN